MYKSIVHMMLAFCIIAMPCLLLLDTSCAPSNKYTQFPSPSTMQAIDVSLCSANDILPGVPALVASMMNKSASDLDKAITGITSGAGFLSKAMLCYLHSLALSDIPSPTGHGDSESNLVTKKTIDSRAKYCEESGTEFCQPTYKAAWVIASQINRGMVIMSKKPEPPPVIPENMR